MQKHVNLVDLVKSFPTHILLQNLASIHMRTSPIKFAHLAEKSGKGSISNLSTKVFLGHAAGADAFLHDLGSFFFARHGARPLKAERSCYLTRAAVEWRSEKFTNARRLTGWGGDSVGIR